ncbi:MAG: ATP-binding protein, partial [Defluviitaleaceae bacterium]|nr:ATP-binding protein [Defluviitaleaceae bacterium]
GNGVYAIEKNGTTFFTEDDGLTGGVILRMLAEKNGNGVWVGASPGLYFIDANKNVHAIEKVPPYLFLDILQFEEDLLLLSSMGIIRTNTKELLDPDAPFKYSAVNRTSGLTALINANSWNKITPDSELYFCTDRGVYILGLDRKTSSFLPSVAVARIEVDGVLHSNFSGGIIIPRSSDRLTIELSLLSFGFMSDATLHYQLHGQDRDPIAVAANNMELSYTNLAGGRYILRVWARDSTGKRGEMTEILIRKEHKFFERFFVNVFIFLLVCGGVAFIVWLYIRQSTHKVSAEFEAKEHARQLELDREMAVFASDAKSRFIARMSHEIRTPMNAILGITQMELQNPRITKKSKTTFEKIYTSGNILLNIINDLLDMSKIEAGKMELNPIEYDISSIISDVVHINIVQIESKPIEFLVEADEKLPARMFGDELRLKQILNNLCSNAIKYTEKGQVKLIIKHEILDTSYLLLKFTVEDTGQGIKPEDREKLFGNEYLRLNVESNRNTEGTGIGLNIVKNLVELMDGTVEVESEFGSGSKFRVSVKQKAVKNCEPIGKEISENLKNFTFVENVMEKKEILHDEMPYGKILIVDDVETNIYVAKGLLQPYKLQIETSTNGFDVIEKIKGGKKYDIIFMDHMMPELDGIETTNRLRDSKYTGTIIALTANAMVGNDKMFLEHGFDDFISKPIDAKQLNTVLNKWVRDKNPEENKKQENKKQKEIPVSEAKPSEKLLEIFRKDAENAIKTLREIISKRNKSDVKLFTTTTHAMRSALLNVGEKETAELAGALEEAGNKNDTDFISENTENFIAKLEETVKNLCPPAETTVPDDEIVENKTILTAQLLTIKIACENFDEKTAYAAFDFLKTKKWKSKTTDALEEMRDLLYLQSDFDGAAEQVVAMLKTL